MSDHRKRPPDRQGAYCGHLDLRLASKPNSPVPAGVNAVPVRVKVDGVSKFCGRPWLPTR